MNKPRKWPILPGRLSNNPCLPKQMKPRVSISEEQREYLKQYHQVNRERYKQYAFIRQQVWTKENAQREMEYRRRTCHLHGFYIGVVTSCPTCNERGYGYQNLKLNTSTHVITPHGWYVRHDVRIGGKLISNSHIQAYLSTRPLPMNSINKWIMRKGIDPNSISYSHAFTSLT